LYARSAAQKRKGAVNLRNAISAERVAALRRRLELISTFVNSRLRLYWRSLALLCGIVTAVAASDSLQAAQRELVFQLDPVWIGADLAPLPEWTRRLYVSRDGISDSFHPVPFHLPTSALDDPRLRGLFHSELSDDEAVSALSETIRNAPGVIWSEITIPRHTDAVKVAFIDGADAPPDDPFYMSQWSLHRIQAPAAWDISRGDTSVTIAIIDVGTDIGHGDLLSQRWINWVERNGQSGVDDDRNGFIDDVNGWDFSDNDADPRPENGDEHGTHVAGIASAATDNGYGIAGVGWKTRIMAIRAGNGATISNGFEGLIYAAANGADVANLSWGSELASHLEEIAVEYANDHGCLVVAAAGNNDGRGSFDHYPAAYARSMAVAGTNDQDRRGYFSNAAVWVDISAPGDKILSLFPGNSFGVEDGTSMSTPLVAGAAGLIKAVHPDWSPDRIAMQLKVSADPLDELNPSDRGTLGAGRLNLFRALSDQRVRFGITSIVVDDSTRGNDNGMIDPAENINLHLQITNLLSLLAEVEMTLISSDPAVTIDLTTIPLAEIVPGGTGGNLRTPFRLRISGDAAAGRKLKLVLQLSRDGRVLQEIPFILEVKPSHAELTSPKFSATVSDFGTLGYYDYLNGKGVGVGFRFPADGPSTLYHGSLMIGSPGAGVSDCAYGNAEKRRYDFRPLREGIGVKREGEALIARSAYDDIRAETPLDLTIHQTSYLFPGDSVASLILDYQISDAPRDYSDLYIGLYLDWDVIQADENRLIWDDTEKVGWMEQSGGNTGLFGGCVLSREPDFHYAVDNSSLQRQFSDSTKFVMMQSQFGKANGDTAADWSQFFGVGPITLLEGDTARVTFALVAGKDRSDLLSAVEAGRRRFGSASLFGGNTVPSLLSIESLYPMPFNGSVTVISRSQSGLPINWRLIDPLGRVAYSGRATAVGERVKMGIEFRDLAAGRYFIEVNDGKAKAAAPLILLK